MNTANLVFEDNFNREEKDDSIEQLGNGWQTNSKNRAQGHKQADLRNNELYIEMWKDATHGTSILHKAPFDDGIVSVKFKMCSLNNKGKAIQFNFNDPHAKDKTVNGHVCQIAVDPKILKIEDQYTGRFNPILRKKLKNGTDKKEVRKVLAEKIKNIKVNLELNKWYKITMYFKKDTLTVFIDSTYIGEHKSEGFDMQKDNIAFSLWSTSGVFDDLQIWALD
ncbi:family 16 glycoside hydrolase [Seonamhaeicola marinus]|uniref:3-keto-alpha-glucoside-1,2-lyase/3-keto-2-hydroxy-glucal hydratase domain-containing protein n=1 Tax=Seonamhaeicola marinus TaxID=1912246 RepID=A0A5D0HVZ2_9FLAO|nr:family 16 glycoside hydrolase [Seonamhaeicola marinus]TYA74287.1 hypothetical protein FUA24_13230 [Seonamhaeicola marinus]